MPARTPGGKEEQQAAEIQRLSARLEEAEETLRAIRAGEVDAPVVSSAHGEQVFTLSGADHSYRALVEEMNEGALSLRVDGVILHANRRFAAMLRAPLERVTGTNIGGWIAPESRQALSTLLKDGTSRQCRAELDLAALDGTDVPVYLSIYPLSLNGAGNTLGAVATDLTEKKKQQTKLVLAERAAREALQVAGQTRVALLEKIEDHRRSEQALRTSEARFRHIFETSPLGKVLVTMDGDVQFNEAFCEILGYPEAELRAKSWRELTHPDDVAATEDVIQRLLQGSISSSRSEKRYIHKDGSVVWADTTIGVARDAGGKALYILTAIIDITARKQADAAVLDLKQHLQRNIEMERLRLAQDLHDVPIQELFGVMYELEQLRLESGESIAAVLGESVEHLQKTLNMLRSTASELRPPALSRFGLEKAVRSYIGDFREKNPHIRVRLSLAPDSQLLPEDIRLVLFRVLQESLSNVVRHAAATEVHLRFNFDAEEARLEISDNGKGFSVPGDWVGLVRAGHYGLAGMSERVSAAGGTLAVGSSPGSSTTVCVAIPYSLAGV